MEVARLGLTDTPLDLDNPAHLDALKRVYARFPEIGGARLRDACTARGELL
ncbi:DUF5953 family protein [Cystobacter fuscus]|uniref:DUF5953 family protein n=1 Tax=Cystobacter fuscus TaxID=43 RepID=UPI0018DF4800